MQNIKKCSLGILIFLLLLLGLVRATGLTQAAEAIEAEIPVVPSSSVACHLSDDMPQATDGHVAEFSKDPDHSTVSPEDIPSHASDDTGTALEDTLSVPIDNMRIEPTETEQEATLSTNASTPEADIPFAPNGTTSALEEITSEPIDNMPIDSTETESETPTPTLTQTVEAIGPDPDSDSAPELPELLLESKGAGNMDVVVYDQLSGHFGDTITLAISIRYTQGGTVYDSNADAQGRIIPFIGSGTLTSGDFDQSLNVQLDRIEIAISSLQPSNFPFSPSVLNQRQILLSNKRNHGYAVFADLPTVENVAPGIYPVHLNATWQDTTGVVYTRILSVDITVQAALEAASKEPGDIILGMYEQSAGIAGGTITLAVPIRYIEEESVYDSNANADNEIIPYSPAGRTGDFDQSITAVLLDMDIAISGEQPENFPLDPEVYAQEKPLLLGGENLGYAVFDSLSIPEDVEPGVYAICLDAKWLDLSGETHIKTLTAQLSIVQTSVIVADGIVVYTFTELKNAVQSGAYNKVYLGYNQTNLGTISYTARNGIRLHSDMTRLEIVGTDPLTEHRMTLKDYPSISPDDILQTTRNGQMLILRDVTVIGSNPYGIVYSPPGQTSQFIFENMTYSGASVSTNYHANSSVTYIDCNITITDAVCGTSDEASKTCNLTFYGNNTFKRQITSNNLGLFKMYVNGTFHVASGADLNIETNQYIIDVADICFALIEGSMTMTTTGKNGCLTYTNQSLQQVTVANNGSLRIRHEGIDHVSLRTQQLIVRGVLDIAKTSGAQPCIEIPGTGSAHFESPRRVSLTGVGGALMRKYGSGEVSLRIDTQALNLTIGSQTDIWNNNHLEPFTVTASLSTLGSTASVTSTLQQERGAAYGARSLDNASFNLSYAHSLRFGAYELTINPVYYGIDKITGTAAAGSSQIITEYPRNNQVIGAELQTATGSMDGNHYSTSTWIPVGLADIRVYVKNTHDQLMAEIYADNEYICSLEYVTPDLAFGPVGISDKQQLLERADPVWRIDVLDTSPSGYNWKIYANAPPFISDDGQHQLDGGIVFMSESALLPITDAEGGKVLIAERPSNASRGVVTLTWDQGEGPYAYVNPDAGIPGTSYSTTITWWLEFSP